MTGMSEVATVFPAVASGRAAIAGSRAHFPVHRIYCVGRNYAAHAREMGTDPTREPPCFFLKPADAIVSDQADIPYPPRTRNLHHEVELVVALGADGANLRASEALGLVFGYAVGNDLTRRDLQNEAKSKGQPWDTGKSFEHCAALGAIRPAGEIGHPAQGRIALSVNGRVRQQADLAEMIWTVADVLAELSSYYALRAGDLIYTGTPEGVGALERSDAVFAEIEGVGTLTNRIV